MLSSQHFEGYRVLLISDFNEEIQELLTMLLAAKPQVR